MAVHCRGHVLERAPVEQLPILQEWGSREAAGAAGTGCRKAGSLQEPEDRTPDGGRKSPSSCTVSPAPSTDRA